MFLRLCRFDRLVNERYREFNNSCGRSSTRCAGNRREQNCFPIHLGGGLSFKQFHDF